MFFFLFYLLPSTSRFFFYDSKETWIYGNKREKRREKSESVSMRKWVEKIGSLSERTRTRNLILITVNFFILFRVTLKFTLVEHFCVFPNGVNRVMIHSLSAKYEEIEGKIEFRQSNIKLFSDDVFNHSFQVSQCHWKKTCILIEFLCKTKQSFFSILFQGCLI